MAELVKYYLVDLIDHFVLYSGTFSECEEVINTSYGGAYGILTYEQMTDEERNSNKYLVPEQDCGV